jgi:hypothetical protein
MRRNAFRLFGAAGVAVVSLAGAAAVPARALPAALDADKAVLPGVTQMAD